MRFQVVYSGNFEDFGPKVQAALEEGWELHGQPFAARVPQKRPPMVQHGGSKFEVPEVLAQALVKKD